jgi:hypothetical protein
MLSVPAVVEILRVATWFEQTFPAKCARPANHRPQTERFYWVILQLSCVTPQGHLQLIDQAAGRMGQMEKPGWHVVFVHLFTA